MSTVIEDPMTTHDVEQLRQAIAAMRGLVINAEGKPVSILYRRELEAMEARLPEVEAM